MIKKETSKEERMKKFTKTGVIYKTKDYDLFSFFDENRDRKPAHISNLRKAIKDRGNLTEVFTIIVDKKFRIMDGQNRFMALKLDKGTVYFQITDKLTMDEVPKASALNKRWLLTDYLRSYVKRYNNGERKFCQYAQFEGYMNRWGFSPSVTMILLHGDRSQPTVETFKDGTFKIARKWDWHESFAEDVHSFARWINFYTHRSFVVAYIMLYTHPDYNHRKMLQKMQYLSSKCVKQPDTFAYARMLESIYNHKCQNHDRISIVARYWTIDGKPITM